MLTVSLFLEPHTWYEINLLAYNQFGTSDLAERVIITKTQMSNGKRIKENIIYIYMCVCIIIIIMPT